MDRAVWKPQLTLLNETKIGALHKSATTILEQTGLNVHHPELRLRLAEAGAQLDNDGLRLYFPPKMVEQAISRAGREVVIHNRLGEPAMPLGPHQLYCGTGSDLVHTRDLETEEWRISVLDDVARSARLCDALDEIDFVMSFAVPSDIPNEDAEPQQYYAMVQNSTKPIIMTSFSGLATFERMHQMACLIAGGDAAFRQRPNYIVYGQFISPLQHDLQALERLVFCAEQEVPLIYVPTIMPGASGPVTLTGSLALAVAEFLAGLVMHQTVKPGAPFICGACVGRMDWHTLLFPYGSPEWRLNDLVMAEMSRHYGLPVFGTGGASDSKLVDAQAGAEYAGSLLVAALAGTNLIHDVGYLDSGLTGSLESIILAAEQIRWVKQFVDGFEVGEETLALEVIKEVGPAGDFMGHDHTFNNFRRNMWTPYVSNHDSYEGWAAAGAKEYAARAREYAKQLVDSHRPQPLNQALAAQLQDLCSVAQTIE